MRLAIIFALLICSVIGENNEATQPQTDENFCSWFQHDMRESLTSLWMPNKKKSEALKKYFTGYLNERTKEIEQNASKLTQSTGISAAVDSIKAAMLDYLNFIEASFEDFEKSTMDNINLERRCIGTVRRINTFVKRTHVDLEKFLSTDVTETTRAEFNKMLKRAIASKPANMRNLEKRFKEYFHEFYMTIFDTSVADPYRPKIPNFEPIYDEAKGIVIRYSQLDAVTIARYIMRNTNESNSKTIQTVLGGRIDDEVMQLFQNFINDVKAVSDDIVEKTKLPDQSDPDFCDNFAKDLLQPSNSDANFEHIIKWYVGTLEFGAINDFLQRARKPDAIEQGEAALNQAKESLLETVYHVVCFR